MYNNDLTQHCPDELILWKDNDEYFARAWRHSIRTGNLSNIKDAFDEAGFKYRDDQYERLVDEFEEELQAEEDRQEAEAKEADTFFLDMSNKSN